MKSLGVRVGPRSSERLLKRNRGGQRAKKGSVVRGDVWNDGTNQGVPAATRAGRLSRFASEEGVLKIPGLWTSGL